MCNLKKYDENLVFQNRNVKGLVTERGENMRIYKVAAAIVLLTLASGCGGKTVPLPSPSSLPAVTPSPTIAPTPTPIKQELSVTTGLQIKSKNHRSMSVMIENSPDARPHTGLSQADIVYEVKTEGDISRYMAIFNDTIPEKIGPVRSARHYFVPIAMEWNIAYIHFGGSWYAYNALEKVTVPVIDGITTDGLYFKRDSSRKAPHNAYLYPATLKYETTILKEHFQFNSKPLAGNSVKNVGTINLSYNGFTDIEYRYDGKQKAYLRFQEGVAQIDLLNNEQIKTQNIVILKANHTPVKNDPKGRIDVALIGEGQMTLYRDGKQIQGKWKKENEDSPMSFFYNEGNAIELAPGKTWIQIIEPTQNVVEK
jgi:hypothetical protein